MDLFNSMNDESKTEIRFSKIAPGVPGLHVKAAASLLFCVNFADRPSFGLR